MAGQDDDDEFERLLNDFIATQLEDVEDEPAKKEPPQPAPKAEAPTAKETKIAEPNREKFSDDDEDDDELAMLKDNEKALCSAVRNFQSAVEMIAAENNIKNKMQPIEPIMLFPNYKPSVGQMINQEIIKGWDILIKACPETIQKINPSSSDEELLDFAEKSDDENVQFAIISYVEALIEMEGCEIAYKEHKLKKEKKRLERKIYEEHQRRISLMNRYIEAIREKKFPINAERLVKNYFKTAQKDADGAFKVLTTSPAVFAPIEFDKIKPRLFGLIKVSPQDGIRFNKLIGDFLKKLKR